MTASELKKKYLDFFVKKGHQILPNVSLVPENDPSALFISAGMHPLVPFLLGETHSLGQRLVSVQRCLRTDDIDEVGDAVHHTFFEMLGNWSLGDYFKKEMIPWSFEFLTSERYLGIPREKLAVTVFAGDNDAPFDKESYDLWIDQGISSKRIAKLPKKNNWWGPVGQTGPCGPDSEMFYWTGKDVAPAIFDTNDPRWVEIWNDVFMEFNKKEDGSYEPLKQKNVDTGMGLERTSVVLQGKEDVYQIDTLWPIVQVIEGISGKNYQGEFKKPIRVITDHLRAAVFLIADGVEPLNVDQGYVLRRLIRRAIVQLKILKSDSTMLSEFLESGYKLKPVIDKVVEIYKDEYKFLDQNLDNIQKTVSEEWTKFSVGVRKGYPQLLKVLEKTGNIISGEDVFHLFDTYGVQPEVTEEAGRKYHKDIDFGKFEELFKKHQEVSRAGSGKKFAGGLADHSEESKKYHTAAHLLHAALRKILGTQIRQAGQNITAERLRFDFTYPQKLTVDQLKEVEDLVNQKIKEDPPVKMEIMTLSEAKDQGALAFFEGKYGEKVKVYAIDHFSREVCGGPHVGRTGEIGSVKIFREEAVGSGKRRIYIKLAQTWK